MSTPCKCWAVSASGGKLEPFQIQRRACSKNDVVISIKYAGICHSDIHQVKEDWGGYT